MCVYVCANLFDIVNTGQHPDASVVEDGELFCQLLLAGLDHTPRHLLTVSVKFSRKNITNLRSLWLVKGRKKEAVIYAVVRFRPCSDIRGQQLPVLHPSVSLPFFLFSVTGMRSCPGFHNEAGFCCVQWILVNSILQSLICLIQWFSQLLSVMYPL